MNLGQEQSSRDTRPRFIGVLNCNDSFENRTVMDVRQVLKLASLGRQYRAVQRHVVIFYASHIQRRVVRAGLDADIALSPTDHPEIIPGNATADFRVAGLDMFSHELTSGRSICRLHKVARETV